MMSGALHRSVHNGSLGDDWELGVRACARPALQWILWMALANAAVLALSCQLCQFSSLPLSLSPSLLSAQPGSPRAGPEGSSCYCFSPAPAQTCHHRKVKPTWFRMSPAWPALAVTMTTPGLEMSLATSTQHIGWLSQAPFSEKPLQPAVLEL